MEFREWLISKDIPFKNSEDNNLIIQEECLVPYYEELLLLFPKMFQRPDDEDEIPHRS